MYVDSLLHMIDYGAAIGFAGSQSEQTCRNLSTALEHPDTITADLAALCSQQRMHGPFSSLPLPQFRTSLLGVVSRPRNPAKLRVINHLSWPDGSSVNDGIPDTEASIVYEAFDSAVSEIRRLGRGCLLAKLDLKDAFRHIPICPADWNLLGCTWGNQFYYSVVLVFGAKSAPYIFNLFAEGFHWIIQHHIPASLRHYLDNFLPIFPPATPLSLANAAVDWTTALGKELGFTIQEAKTIRPTQALEFLGLELDTEAMEARMPPDKILWLGDLLAHWRHQCVCRLHDLQVLIGFLQFAAQVIPHARAFIRWLIEFAATFSSDFVSRHIPRYACADIQWWSVFHSRWNGVHLIAPSQPTIHVYTDASGSERKGIGGSFGDFWYASRIPRRFRKRDIQFKELYAVVQATLRWGEQWSGCHVVFHIDNQAIVDAIETDRNRSRHTMSQLRILLMLAACLQFSFSAEWLPSKENTLADAASHFQYSLLFQLAPHLRPKPCSQTPQLNGMRRTLASLDKWHATSGTASLPAPVSPTVQGNVHTLTSHACTLHIATPTADSSQLLSTELWSGQPLSGHGGFSPKPSKHTCQACTCFTSTPTSPSPPASLRLYNASCAGSSAAMESATATLNSPSLSPYSSRSAACWKNPMCRMIISSARR